MKRYLPGLTAAAIAAVVTFAAACGDDGSPPYCGDGILADGEHCDDGNQVNGDGCSADCLSDESCGNGVVDVAAGESCDDGNAAGGDGCSVTCQLEYCGNAVVDQGEACDDGNHAAGDGCSPDCLSTEVCGNNITDVYETCDGTDVGSVSCVSQGYDGGTLVCSGDCNDYDPAACYVCGDSGVGGAEICDGTDLDGQSCATQGYDAGELGCAGDCGDFDTSGCWTCGDGVIGVGEVCDGTSLGGLTCYDLHHEPGTAACAGDCLSFDTSGCGPHFPCGNGVIDAGEQCDGNDVQGFDCAALGIGSGAVGCDPWTCVFDTSGCVPSVCGNGVAEPGEQCDGNDFGGRTCMDYGWPAPRATHLRKQLHRQHRVVWLVERAPVQPYRVDRTPPAGPPRPTWRWTLRSTSVRSTGRTRPDAGPVIHLQRVGRTLAHGP